MTTGVSYKTNNRPRNRSIEERLERAVDHLEDTTGFFDPDDMPFYDDHNIATAENADVIYERVGNCIAALERFLSKLDIPECC